MHTAILKMEKIVQWKLLQLSGVILYYLIAHFPEFRVLCTTTQSCLKICLEFLKYSLMSDEYKKVFFLGVATRLGPGDSV